MLHQALNAADDSRQKGRRFINRGGRWLRPSESLWSVIHKFAYLNHLSSAEVRSLVMPGADYLKAGNVLPWTGDDVRLDVLIDYLELKFADLYFSRVKDFLFPVRAFNNWQTWCAQYLRFCPKCMSTGFHSALHQLTYLTKCPWHGVRLVDRCMHGNRVDCRLGVDQLAKPYSCVDGVPLWTGIAESEWPYGADEINEQLLKDLESWVRKFAVRQPSRSIFAIRNYRRIESRHESIADAFADSVDWRALEPSIVGFLSRIAAGPEWLTRSTSGFGSGEIVTSKFKTDRGELAGVESPSWPFRLPDIASVPYEWEAYQTEVPTTHRYWTELRGRCLKTIRSVVETFADMVERHVAACPARSVLTGLSPGGACHLKYAITNCRLLFGVDDRARGDGATSTREDWRCLRPAVARTLDAQLERMLVWVNVPWAVLQFSSVESTRLISWLVEQASAALVRNVLERLLFDSVSAQCKVNEPKMAEPGVCAGHRVPLMDQDSFVAFSPDKWAAPFAVTANLDEEEVSFHAYHAIPSHRWTYIAEHGDLCRETGMSPVTPAIVRIVLEKLNIPDPRYGPRTHQVLAKKMTASRIAG